jgi:DNA-binding NarL/FixJ family response regulator
VKSFEEDPVEDVLVAVHALDPLTGAGLVACLSGRQGMVVGRGETRKRADVIVAAFDELDPAAVGELETALGNASKPVVLLMDPAEEVELPSTLEPSVVAVLPRAAVVDDRLPRCVRAAAVDTAGLRLLTQERRTRQGAPVARRKHMLSQREVAVVRLMAEGCDTNEIARRMRYADHTVKNIIYSLTHRLGLRNRSHAVAYALRAGII